MDAEEASLRLLYGDLFEVVGRPDAAGSLTTDCVAATHVAADAGHVVQVTMRMKDAACPVSSLTLRLERPAGYPALTVPPVVTCVASKPVLPHPVVRALNTLLMSQCAAAAGGKAPIKSVLRWLDNHFSSIFESIIELQAEAAARGRAAATDEVDETTRTVEQVSAPATSVPEMHSAATTAHAVVESASGDETTATQLSPGIRAALDATWTLPEQRALETALHTVLFVEGSSVSARGTWNAVAQAVGGTKTPSDCLARYIVLRRLTGVWYAGRAPASPEPEPEPESEPETALLQPSHTTIAAASSDGEAGNTTIPIVTTEDEGDASDSSTEMRRYRRMAASREERDLPQLQVKAQARGVQGKPPVKAPLPITSFADLRPARGGVHDKGQKLVLSREEAARMFESEGIPLPVAAVAAAARQRAAVDLMEERTAARGVRARHAGTLVHSEEDGEEKEASGTEDVGESAGESEGEVESEGEEQEEEQQEHLAAPFSGLHLHPEHRGAQIMFEELDIYGIGSLAATRLDLSVQCDRCAHVLDASVVGVRFGRDGEAHASQPTTKGHSSGGAAGSTSVSGDAAGAPSGDGNDFKAWCAKCSLLLSFTFRPTLIHEGGLCVGYADTTHCTLPSVRGVRLACTCLECGLCAEVPHLRFPGTWEQACIKCYSRMRLDSSGPPVVHIATHDNAASFDFRAAGVAPPGSKKQTAKWTHGKPLPLQGACKHYAHSYRWLRFPCCGAAFPCDACHDEASDHVHEWATRMICGHCAREQPYHNSPCVACGRAVRRGGGPAPRFWEGGGGQRNPRLMSSKDAHKFKGSAMKTKSNKKSRVGAKAKAKAGSGS